LVFWIIFFFPIGIKWGIPSRKTNDLYFYNKEELFHTLDEIKKYKEEIWKGYGYYLALHPEEAEKKLPRNLYNPVRSYHPDEYFVIKSIASIKPENLDFNPYQFTVGGVYLYLIGILILISSKIGFITLTKDLSFFFTHPEEMGKFYLIGRMITAIYGMGIIILAFLIARKTIYKNSNYSFIFAAFLSLTPLMILNSSYMYVDIPGLFWIMASMYLTLLAIERFSFTRIVLSGIFAGLACGTKITFITALFIPLSGIFLIHTNWKKIITSIFFTFAGFLMAFSITNPYFFITFPAPLYELSEHTGRIFSGSFYLKSLFYGMGSSLFILCLTGIISNIVLINRCNIYQKKVFLLNLSWCIFFFFFISSFSKNFARYILPVVPSLIILGTIGYFILYEYLYPVLKKCLTIILLLVLCWTFIYGMAFKMLFVKENIRTEAGVWIKENIPQGSSMGVTEVPWQFQMPPFDYYVYPVVVTGYNIEELKKKQPDFFILSSFQAPIPPYPLRLQEERKRFYEEFMKSGLYSEIKRFERYPSFLCITFKNRTLPEDLIYLNPTIVIFSKKEAKK